MLAKPTYETLASQGRKFLEAGNYLDAKASFQNALEVDPLAYDGWLSLSESLYYLGDYPGAIKACERSESLDPLQAKFQNIQRAMQSQNFATAKKIAHEMLDQCPGHPRAIFTLAHLHQSRRAYEDQVEVLENGVKQAPGNIFLLQMLVGALENSGRIIQAIETARHLLDMQNTFANAWSLIGLYIRYGLNEEALSLCETAKHLSGGDRSLLSELDLLRGHASKTLGRPQDAISAYKTCIINKPNTGSPWWGLADMKTYAFSTDEIHQLQTLVARKTLTPEHQCQAQFALAKAHESVSGLGTAMPFYKAANLAFAGNKFNAERFSIAAKNLITSFNERALRTTAARDQKEPRPIFILGLPRSGSTLLEQILASHSKIEGTMELPVLPNIKRMMHLESQRRGFRSFLDSIERFSEADLRLFGQLYLDQSALFRSEDTPFFIDKLPNNFEHVGLIHKILPGAIILDIRRHPLDCGLSLFKQFFARGVEFSYDLGSIGVYYSEYLKIMEHWDEVLPNRVLHIQYENLVQNLEPILRRILEHIGLSFEPACLEFYKNKRAVRTASSEQVRTPIFTNGIGAWRNVAEDLEPLKSALRGPSFEGTLANF